MLVSDILSVEGPDTFTRPIYAGTAVATVRSSDAKRVLTVRGTAFEKAAREGGTASIEPVQGKGDQGLSSFVGAEIAASERPELTSAKIIVSGGRALGSSDAFHQYIEPLADKLVAAECYVAIGISGAIQHLAGMKDSKLIVAINKDEEAPTFQVADIGLVGDLFKIVPELTEKL